jgi:hypothetical protein
MLQVLQAAASALRSRVVSLLAAQYFLLNLLSKVSHSCCATTSPAPQQWKQKEDDTQSSKHVDHDGRKGRDHLIGECSRVPPQWGWRPQSLAGQAHRISDCIRCCWGSLGPLSFEALCTKPMLCAAAGVFEREGCIRLNQVWNSPSNAEMNQAYLAASDEMAGLKGAPNEQFQNRAYVISHELGQALKKMAKGITPKAEAQTRRERSPSVEMV